MLIEVTVPKDLFLSRKILDQSWHLGSSLPTKDHFSEVYRKMVKQESIHNTYAILEEEMNSICNAITDFYTENVSIIAYLETIKVRRIQFERHFSDDRPKKTWWSDKWFIWKEVAVGRIESCRHNPRGPAWKYKITDRPERHEYWLHGKMVPNFSCILESQDPVRSCQNFIEQHYDGYFVVHCLSEEGIINLPDEFKENLQAIHSLAGNA